MSLLPVGISGEEAGYQIERSLRFNSADSAYLNRTPGSASNRKTWTWSGWVKRSALGSIQTLFNAGANSATTGYTFIDFTSTDTFRVGIRDSGGVQSAITTQVFRDPSAWGHLIVAVDTTQATASNRVKIYFNGSQISALGTANYPTQNTDTSVNNTVAQRLGVNVDSGGVLESYLNGYLTEINFIDGQALTPTSFGEFNSDTGVWQPKAYTGSYGTNGFYLNFSDNSGVTSTTLGADSSGNGNNWTPNNFSVTAGAGNDSLVDTPTPYGTDTGLGGQVRGNYATWNGVSIGADATLTNGNLDISYGSSVTRNATMGTFGMSSGKWYWEVTITASSASPTAAVIGITNEPSAPAVTAYPGYAANGWGYLGDGDKYNNLVNTAYGATFTTNDVIGFAFDADAGSITAYKNGVSQGVMFSSLAANTYYPAIGDGSGASTFSASANFGQRPFAYTAPSGFKALCTQNLPEPTIVDGGDYFNTVLYTGTAATQTINTGFAPDLVWVKSRSNVTNNVLSDRVRGNNLFLISDNTNAEAAINIQFASNGFTTSASSNAINGSGLTYVAWNWKANGAGVSNTAGTITSTVSANTDSGFSIVTYTGTGSAATIGHGLGAVPRMIIVKNRDAADAWQVYHAANTANPETDYLVLNTTAATADAADRWNDTLPTSTVFSIGNGVEVNTNTEDYVAYVFAAIPGYSAFGSYTGNGSTDGPFVYTGFRPRFILLKRSSGIENWQIYDTVRDTYNVVGLQLIPNTSGAEVDGRPILDVLSNGFKLRNATGGGNAAATYIYAAFAENAFKVALAR